MNKLAPEEAEVRKQQLMEETAKKTLNALWKFNKIDVESILMDVCDAVLNEPNLTEQDQRNRAEGLRELGLIFRRVKGKTNEEKLKDQLKPETLPNNNNNNNNNNNISH